MIASVPASSPAVRMKTRLSSFWRVSICEGMSTLTKPITRAAEVVVGGEVLDAAEASTG
jgi:hypothetical protein